MNTFICTFAILIIYFRIRILNKMFKNKSIIAYFIGGLIIVSFLFFFFEEEKKVINYISYFGTYLSLFALVITIQQILTLKDITLDTQKKIDEALDKTFKTLTISKISKSIQIIKEIQGYLKDEKFEAAMIRINDLKNFLIHIKQIKSIEDHIDIESYGIHLSDISIESTNLDQQIYGTGRNINKKLLITKLSKVENFLVEIEGKLKYK